MSAISAPRKSRIRRARGDRRVSSIDVVACRYRISPLVICPGGSISCRTARIVTLFPQPLSPTMPTTSPGKTSKLTPSTARTMPSSMRKDTCRLRTRSSGSGSVTVGIGGISQYIAHEVERQHRGDHDESRNQQPRRESQRLDVLRLLQEYTPA